MPQSYIDISFTITCYLCNSYIKHTYLIPGIPVASDKADSSVCQESQPASSVSDKPESIVCHSDSSIYQESSLLCSHLGEVANLTADQVTLCLDGAIL